MNLGVLKGGKWRPCVKATVKTLEIGQLDSMPSEVLPKTILPIMRLFLIALMAALLVSGCATKTPDVVSYIDSNSGSRTDLMSENLLESPGTPRELVWLNASRVFTNSRDYRYYLEVEYIALPETGYLDIRPGETLSIIADGEILQFSGSGSLNTRKQRREELRERAIYAVTGHQLRVIASAQTVKVSIVGKNGIVQREFVPANSDKFRRFVAKFVTTA